MQPFDVCELLGVILEDSYVREGQGGKEPGKTEALSSLSSNNAERNEITGNMSASEDTDVISEGVPVIAEQFGEEADE